MTDEQEQFAEMMIESQKQEMIDEIQCSHCSGLGYTAEHDPTDPHDNGCSSCPIQVQCEHCQGTGMKPEYQNEVQS